MLQDFHFCLWKVLPIHVLKSYAQYGFEFSETFWNSLEYVRLNFGFAHGT